MSVRRVYETTLIINAALEDPDIDGVIRKVTGYIENHGGEILKIDRWGRKRLTFPINKKFNGFYARIEFDAMPNTVPIIERFLVLEDTVLRHLSLVLPEELRELRKQKELERGKAAEEEAKKAEESKKESEKKEDKKESTTAE